MCKTFDVLKFLMQGFEKQDEFLKNWGQFIISFCFIVSFEYVLIGLKVVICGVEYKEEVVIRCNGDFVNFKVENKFVVSVWGNVVSDGCIVCCVTSLSTE